MTVDQQLDALGGNTAVARELDLVQSAPSNWRKVGAIPPAYFLRLQRFAERLGVELDESLFIERPRYGRRTPAAAAS